MSSDPLNRMHPQLSEGVFRAREVRRLEQKDWRDKEMIEAVVGGLWRLTDGR